MSDEEIVKEFLVESHENLDRLDQELISLEKNPGDRDTLASIFRTIHTIKGTSGFLAFNQLEAVTHVGENLLSRLRDGSLALTPEITTALLTMIDAVRQMLGSIEANGTEGERDDQQLIATLARLQQSEPSAPAPPRTPLAPAPEPARAAIPAASGSKAGTLPPEESKAPEEAAVETPVPLPAAESRPVEPAAKPPEPADVHPGQQPGRGAISDSTIRVDVGQLDKLMNRMGELVLLRNQIVQYTSQTEDSALLGTSQRLNLLTTELQEGVMKTRMQPIGNIWSKFPRTVRDVAVGCGKQVRIEMEGKETELDKTIIEAIKDPLTHLVRNSVDHGIESPEVRRSAGKNPEGLLTLRAFHEGGQVNIEITDDGGGLDLEKIRNKAIQKALITADQAARMTDREVTHLIFLPGFSTAEKVTSVSGRGVGMDVVRTNIEKIGGTVDVRTRPGHGSTVHMKIPLTLAIIPALIVTTAGDRYAIPQVSLLELVRLEGEQARKGMERVNGAPVYRLRGRLLPLVYLKRELQADGKASANGAPATQLDFSSVRDKHRQWSKTLQKVLEGKLEMTPDQAGSHQTCALGQWIYTTGLATFAEYPDMHLLEETHRRFHERVYRVLNLKRKGASAEAVQELESVGHDSERIMQVLTSVERRVLDLDNVNIVVLRADDRQFGLVVDEINDTEEIVVKPLSKQLKIINTYAGATIMGDGKVALILDVMGLAQRANVISEARAHAVADGDEKPSSSADGQQRNAVLLFEYGDRGRMAVNLAQVARLEEFPRDTVEVAADREVVQYRGRIMPLVRVSSALGQGSESAASRDSLHVVVYSDHGRSVGLVVDRILDIVEESFVLDRQSSRQGVLGSAVIQKRVTDILDVPGLIAAAGGSHLLSPQPA